MSATDQIVEVAVAEVKGFFVPSDAERAAAYELLIELTTRPSSAQLNAVDVTLGAELASIEEMFEITRSILRQHGTAGAKGSAGNLSLAVVALRVLNEVFRPVIDRWRPALDERLAARPSGPDAPTVAEWERSWDRSLQFRADLNTTRSSTRAYVETLAQIAGTPSIADSVLSAPSSIAAPLQRVDTSLDPGGDIEPRRRMVNWFDPVEMFGCWKAMRKGEKSVAAFEARQQPPPGEPDQPIEPTATFDAKKDRDFWFDYACDMGDGFDGTAPVAWMMGRRSLGIPDRLAHEIPTPPASMPRADLVVFGGDLVYPFTSAGCYESQTELPFRMGLEGGPDGSDPTLVTIPANHDWLGGIEHFEKKFIEGERFADHWILPQTHNWFHVELPQGWWIWGVDTGLHDRLVGPQEEYFRRAALKLDAGDRVILVTPVPLWQLRQKRPDDYAAMRAIIDPLVHGREATMPLCISGDSHFFAHFERVDTDEPEDHITAGGAGAFTQPTHNLPERIPLERGNAEYRLTSRWPLSADSRSLAPSAGPRSLQYWPLMLVAALLQLGIWGLASTGATWPWISDESSQGDGWNDEVGGLLDNYLVVGALLLISLLGVVAFRGNSIEPKLTKAARVYGFTAGLALSAVLLLVEATRAWVTPPLASWLTAPLAAVLGGVVGILAFMGVVRWSNRRIKANDSLTFLPAQSTRFKHFLRFRIDDQGDLTCYTIGLDPVGEGWYDAMTLHEGTPAERRKRAATRRGESKAPSHDRPTVTTLPPYDPKGTPHLHYVWGRTYRKFRPSPMSIAISASAVDPEPAPATETTGLPAPTVPVADATPPADLPTPEPPAPADGAPASSSANEPPAPSARLSEAIELVTTKLIDRGHSLLYGGLPDAGLTAELHRIDRKRHAKNPNAGLHLVNYVPETFWIDDTDAGETEEPLKARRVRVKRERLPGEDPIATDIADFTAMRLLMTEDADIRFVIGGKVTPDRPDTRRAPGIIEEAYWALDAGVPLLVAGGFGGAAELIAKALRGELERLEVHELMPHFRSGDVGATPECPPLDVMLRRFRSIGELRNGLTDGENLELLRTREPETVRALVLRSVFRLAGPT